MISLNLTQQPSRKRQQRLRIVEIGKRTHRDSHRAGGFAVDAFAELVNGHDILVFGAGEADVQLDARDAESDFARAGVTETARPQRDVDLVGFAFDEAMVEGLVVLIVEVDRDRPTPPLGGGGSKDPHQRHTGAVFHGCEVFQEPARQCFDSFADDIITNGFNMSQPDLERGDIQVIERPIFKGSRAVGEIVFITLHRCDSDRPACKPGTMKFR